MTTRAMALLIPFHYSIQTEMSKFIAGWYVLYTKPHHEKRVVEELSAEEVSVYFPVRKCLRVLHDRKKLTDVPLFQSYVFVYLKSLKDYYHGLKIKGVVQYVKIGKEIARVSEKVISELKLLIDHGQEVEVAAMSFEQGQQVLIQHGPLTGMVCEVVQQHNKQKILTRIHFMNRALLVALPSDNFVDTRQLALVED